VYIREPIYQGGWILPTKGISGFVIWSVLNIASGVFSTFESFGKMCSEWSHLFSSRLLAGDFTPAQSYGTFTLTSVGVHLTQHP